jgi:3-methylcrotonyl-CoA carboxylase alpha subunit
VAEIRPLGNGRFLIADETRQRVAYAVTAGRTKWIFVEGRTFVIEETARNRERGTGNDDLSLSAPMPATVSSIKAKPGEQVARGDVLVMLEAMKMELPIKAPRDGRVKIVACREGELVQPGVPLVEIE